MKQFFQVLAIGLALSLGWCPLPAMAQATPPPVITQVATGEPIAPEALLTALAADDVVLLGETHDAPADHQAQLAIVQGLHERRAKLAIGLEMFQRPFQPVLDRYLAGEISETQLREDSEYDDRWGFDWELYAPILRYAQAQKIPLLALNTPTEVTHKVARSGLNYLSASDRQWIPPLPEIDTGNAAYRERIYSAFAAFHQGRGVSEGFENFFLAQVVWDETMAESIVKSLESAPDRLVVGLVGQGHVVYGDGIPDRVRRRLPAVKLSTLLLNPDEETQEAAQSDRAIADYFWLSESAP